MRSPRQFVPLSGDRIVNLGQVVLIERSKGPNYDGSTGEYLVPPCYRLRFSDGSRLVVNGREARRLLARAARMASC